ncbi:MAG TPA: MMPL family transporter [Polyangiaceae bacterium]|nr:MMPL family transporter [Polyangiaceae bacterium]
MRAKTLDRLLSRYTLWAATHPLRVLALALALLAACAGLASQLHIQGDFVSLLPSESGTARRFRAALERKQAGASTLVVIVESPDSRANERFIDALAARLAGLRLASISSFQTGAEAERAYFQENRWLFASERDLRQVRCELRRQREEAALDLGLDEPCDVQVADEMRELPEAEQEPGLTSQSVGSAATTGAAPDAPKSTPLARLKARIEREVAAQDRFKSDYFRSPDGTSYALVIRAATSGMGELSSDTLLARVQGLVDELGPERFHPAAKVGFTGDISNAIAERKSLIADIAVVSALALGLILAVILGYFRSPWSLLHIGASAALGCGVAFSVARLAFGHLNMASGFLGSIIAGNGINIPMMYLARYRELRAAGNEPEPALQQAALDCRRGTWLGAVAAAGAYLSLGVTSFRGFSEFGLIGGTGSVACWVAAFGVCPATIMLVERRAQRATVRASEPSVRHPFAKLLGGLTVGYAAPILLLLVTAALVVARPIAGYLSDPWEYDFGKLRSVSSAQSGAAHFSTRADQIFGSRGAPDLLLSSDMRHTQAVVAALRARDRQLFGGTLVKRVTTVFDYLGGPPATVARKLEILTDIRRELDRISPHLKGEELELAHSFRPPEGLHPLGVADLPPLLRDRFTETDGRFGTAIFVDIDPTLSRSRGEELLKIANLLEGVRDPKGEIAPNASRATVFAEMIRSMTRDAPRTIAVAFAVVVLVSAIATGSLLVALTVLSSLLLAVWFTLGAAAVFEVKLNFLNFVALPLTFGIGVEYAINYSERLRALGDIRRSLESVGGAIIACSLTTMLGYGTLLVGDNLALRSFGKYAVMGELSCLTMALVMLPAGLTLVRRLRKRAAPAEQQPSGH